MTAKGRRRIIKVLIGLVIAMGTVYFVGPRVMAPIVRHRLEKMVSDSLNARLTMDHLVYEFPYGVKAYRAALVTKDENGNDVDLLRVTELELVLAKLPLGDGPLLIEKIIAKEPLGHLVLTENGFLGGKGLVKPSDDEAPEPAPPKGQPAKPKSKKPPKEKPSDYFRLRKLEMTDGQIAFEDRRFGAMPWVIWKNLGVDLNIAPASGSLYKYEMSAQNAPLAVANIRGDFDIDELKLNIAKFLLSLTVERGKPQEQLPPQLQKALQQYDVAGALTLSGSAQMPFKNPEEAHFESTLDMPNASIRVSEGEGRIDRVALRFLISSQDKQAAKSEVTRPIVATELAAATMPATTRPTSAPAARPPALLVKLDLLDITTGDTILHIDKGEALVDPAEDQWRVKGINCRLEIGKDRRGLPTAVERALGKLDLIGKMKMTATASGPLHPIPGKRLTDQLDYEVIAYPRELEVKLPKWSKPFTNVSGQVRANPTAILFENVEGNFQADKFFITSARIPMQGIEKEVSVEQIVGSMQLSGRLLDYPKPFEGINQHLRPSGTFYAIGSFGRAVGAPPGTKPDYRLNIRCDDANALLTKRGIPVTHIKAEVVASTKLIEIKRVEGSVLEGTLTGEGQIAVGKGKDLMYEGSAWVRDLDLKSLAWFVSTEEKKESRLSGKGNINIHVQGTGPYDSRTIVDNFRAKGTFEALDGDFWSVPVIDEISGSTRVARNALTVGQAAAVFEIYDQIVDLKQAAISAPVLGVQGMGKIAFDGTLDLHAVAAPLADWKDQLKRTKIPIISDVAGELAGGIQKMLNSASKNLLYEFRVTGTAKKPKIETVPAPALSDGVAKVFGAMMKGQNLGDLLGAHDDRPKK